MISIRRIGDGATDVSVFYSKGMYEEQAGVKPDGERLAKRVMKGAETINVHNAINHPVAGGFIPAPDDETGTNNMMLIQNAVCVPIKAADGRILGALEGMNKRGEQNTHFTDEDQESLEQLAMLVACAIERLELHETFTRTDLRRQAWRGNSEAIQKLEFLKKSLI